MPLLKPVTKSKKEKIPLTVRSYTLEEIKKYCEWANVESPADFFVAAAEYVLDVDKEWRKHRQQE